MSRNLLESVLVTISCSAVTASRLSANRAADGDARRNRERTAPSAVDRPIGLGLFEKTHVSSARLPAGDRKAGSDADEEYLTGVESRHFVLLSHHRYITFWS